MSKNIILKLNIILKFYFNLFQIFLEKAFRIIQIIKIKRLKIDFLIIKIHHFLIFWFHIINSYFNKINK